VLRSGVLIGDRYRLDERLATGGMGDVWRATDTSLGRTVAVKVLLPSLTDPTFGTRFRAEARMMAALRHPGVVQVYDYGEGTGPDGNEVAYLVMEYVDGQPLSERLEEAGRLPADQTMDVIARAAEALQAAHAAGIVHRDVKPSNLLRRPDGSVVLVDFGIARSTTATAAGLTTTNAVIGTAMYMAPEQASSKPVSAATDIYALGCVAYHCLAGQPPFTGNSPLEIAVRHVTDEPPELPAEVPAPARELVRRALAKEPGDRFPDAAAMAAAARGASDGRAATTVMARPPVPEPSTLEEHPGPRRPSRRVLVAVAAGVLVILAALGTWLALANGDNPSPGGDVVSPTQSAAPGGTEPAQPGGGVTPTRRSPRATATSEESPVRSPAGESSPPAAPTTGGGATATATGAADSTPTQAGTAVPTNVKD
jgi:eukaryotic-like serine/threonine-protein kinase